MDQFSCGGCIESNETDQHIRSNIENLQTSEENFEEIHNLSPIEEESESTLHFKETSANFIVTEPEGSSCEMTEPSYEEYPRILKKIEGNSSSGDERMNQDYYQLRRVEGSYCCFIPEAEASGDNDEAETGLRDKTLKTTVEQLKCRLSQAEREIVALKRRQSPRKCQGHERCKTLQTDLLTWRDNHEKRIDSQIVRWQLAERKIYDEMENTRKVYDNIQWLLETLEKRNTKSYSDLRTQFDLWEKRLKEDVVNLHERNLMEFREQLKAWFEMQNAINSSNIRKEKCEAYKPCNQAAVEKQDKSYKSTELEMATVCEDNAKFLHRIKRIVEFEVQQHRDDLIKRMDQKITELWSAFEDFKHNFHLNRDYCRRSYIEIDNDEAGSTITEGMSDFTCQETAKSYLDTDSEERCTL